MLNWIFNLCRRFLVFSAAVIGIAMAYSWMFGLDDDVRAWTSSHRVATAMLLFVAFVAYSMYAWLDEPHG